MGCNTLCLTLLALFSTSYCQLPCTLITPNVLRVESEETFVLDAQGHNVAFDADILIQDFPHKKLTLAQSKVSLNSGNGFLGVVQATVPSRELLKDPKNKQYVYITVRSSACQLEKVVLLSFHSGYIFVQTDKTIYTPGSLVLYRIYTMNYKLQPVSKVVILEFLTPDGIIVKRDSVFQDSASGIVSKSYNLPDLVSLGTWTISAKYEDSPQQNYSTSFEIKEYVLPSFEVELKTFQNFLYIDTDEFSVDIKARYLYGKPVEGKAFVLFGVKKDNIKTSIPESLTRVEISEGTGSATLKRADLVRLFNNPEDMLEYTLYVTATVITDSGSDMVETELENIFIVSSPYKIDFTKASKYFKPGMPFDLTVFVTNPDGSPANRVPVVAQPGNVAGTTQIDGTTKLTLNTGSNMASLPITVKTTHPALHSGHQASASLTVMPYRPLGGGGNYLHISIAGSQMKPGENVAVNFNIRNADQSVQNQIKSFAYLILSKGRIIKVGRQERFLGQALVTMSLTVTEEFIPSFRIVAYYTVVTSAGREIVSDSLWVDMIDTCMGTTQLEFLNDRGNKVYQPGTSLRLKMRADHKAYVGLVAVDKGVYVLNKKHKISQKKVWDSVEKTDIGCTAGGGADGAGVFYDAGLAVHTNFRITTAQRSEPTCPVRAQRRRRSVELIEIKATKASHYQGNVRKCCLDGMQENPMGHSCEQRSRYILDGKECAAAFLDCCKYIKKKREDDARLKEHDLLGRSDEDSEYMDDADIVSRTEFPESWFWKVEYMAELPDSNGISTKALNVFLKDSITTWEILAVSLSPNKGICVADPFEIQVMKDFFIDLKLPYSVVRNEQVEIRAILFNYADRNIKVRVELTYNPLFCSLSTVKKKFRQEINIRSQSSVAVPIIIVPLELGLHDIEVKAAVSGTFVSDGIRKKLKVVPEGMRLTHTVKSVTLEPEVKGKDGVQEENVPPLDSNNIVPRSDIDTIITIQGTPISRLVEDAIDGSNLNHLIVVPQGCGEQNMITMTPSVIATHYLDSTGQWERIGVNRREEALNNIKTGYIRQMVYRKTDNSYAAFQSTPSSTWLTAYVAKVFAMAQPLMDIDSAVLCGAIKWLILEKQKPDGLFAEEAPVIHQEMMGGIRNSKEPDAALTAFVLIAMLESQKTCSGHFNNLLSSIDRASNFLLGQYSSLSKPYSIAITSYALAMAGKLQDTNLLMSVAKDNTHWPEDSRFISLEATSYALLALLRMKQYEATGPIVRWLTESRFYGDVWGSTQATIVMFQALAQYQIDIPSTNEIDMDVSLHLPERQQPVAYRINLANAMLARSAETKANKGFVVKAKGKGQGILTVTTVYHALMTEKERKCNNFELTVEVKEEINDRRAPEGTKSTVSITVCFKHLKPVDATMSIIDITMMTGFSPDVEELKKLTNGVDKYISKFEINKGASEKGTLIIYLDKISHTETECLKVYAHQFFPVGLIQPAAVTVYDYYSPENRCTTFYHVEKGSSLLGKICKDDVCRCAEENCFMQQQIDDDITAELRLENACQPGVDYVYKATVTVIDLRDDYDTYVMKIEDVIKEGTDENPRGNTRNFISHAKCRKSLKLEVGQSYLIWGTTTDLWVQPSSYSYIIGKETWIERWPNEKECQTAEYQQACEDITVVAENLELGGCPN
ncbi:A.superbus venom factor 1-like [Bombina bombina]|uniref:A.superbus venom factor 1-like n=1 Tax=Bombina bombina TaxID=8345 RepID=UPI00235AA819|nr:A.superbus venom factor 1-like [Bombina bombina]